MLCPVFLPFGEGAAECLDAKTRLKKLYSCDLPLKNTFSRPISVRLGGRQANLQSIPPRLIDCRLACRPPSLTKIHLENVFFGGKSQKRSFLSRVFASRHSAAPKRTPAGKKRRKAHTYRIQNMRKTSFYSSLL